MAPSFKAVSAREPRFFPWVVVTMLCWFAYLSATSALAITVDAANEMVARSYQTAAPESAAKAFGFSHPRPFNFSQYIRVHSDTVPILTEPTFTTETIQCIGLARSSEYFPVLTRFSRVQFVNPFSNDDLNNGTWYCVVTNRRQLGWVKFASAESMEFTNVDAAAILSDGGDSSAGIFVLLGVLGFILFWLFSHGAFGGGSGNSDDPIDVEAGVEGLDESVALKYGAKDKEEEAERDGYIRFAIRVVDADQCGISGVRLYASFILGSTESSTTDGDGWAHFSKGMPLSKMMSGGCAIAEIKAGRLTLDNDVWMNDGDRRSYTVDIREAS